MSKPSCKPKSPHFSSGPCKKFPGWSFDILKNAALSRSHRNGIGYEKLIQTIKKTRSLLRLPDDFKLALTPASCTGAMDMALWNLLGSRGVDSLAFDVFGWRWSNEITKHMRLKDTHIFDAPFGQLPDLSQIDAQRRDVVFPWNATTSGVAIPNADWIPETREGLIFCDATSAALAYDLPWSKLDAVAFSWQKVLGGEAAHGMLALSPRALYQLQKQLPPWPMPFTIQLTKDTETLGAPGAVKEELFTGGVLNTPSLMCVEDWLVALDWAENLGGLPALIRKTDENAAIIWDWVETRDWLVNLAIDRSTWSRTSICLKFNDPKLQALSEKETWSLVVRFCQLLEKENVAYDIKGHVWAKPCIRIWCGPTVEADDLQALLPWLDWAYEEIMK